MSAGPSAFRRVLRRARMPLLALASTAAVAGCGSEGISVSKSNPYYAGAVLFRDHCSGCHTLDAVGAEGSATSVRDRLRNQGPNFNVRRETVENVLYAIRNGGFSGQIMPQNVVVGQEAQEVAQFLAHYAGTKAPQIPSVSVSLPGQGAGASGATGSRGATGATAKTGARGTAGATGTTGAAGGAHRASAGRRGRS
jgi:mono/diheme cytochrome c family protein